MMAWVTCFRVPPPADRTFTARIGASIFFCGYSKWTEKYYLLANGREEEVSEPDLWWCESDDYAKAHQRDLNEIEPRMERASLRRSSRPQQAMFSFASPDSVSLSSGGREARSASGGAKQGIDLA